MSDEGVRVYEEHEKLAAVSDKSQEIGEFMDWLLNSEEYVLAKWDGNFLMSVNVSITTLLAQFYKIDMDKLDREKLEMLAHLPALHQK